MLEQQRRRRRRRHHSEYILGRSFDIRNNNVYIDQLTGSGTIGTTYVSQVLYIGNNNGSSTFGGVIENDLPGGSGTISLTKNGTGTQVLSGTNTYSGSTTVNSGTLQIGNGTAGSISSSSPLVLGGGTFSLLGKTSGTTAQTVASLATTGGGSVISLNPNGGTSTMLTITSTTLSTGGALNFNLSSGTTNASTSTLGNTIVAWNPTLTGGIIGGGYTVTDLGGTGFATVSGGDVVRLTPTGALPVTGG